MLRSRRKAQLYAVTWAAACLSLPACGSQADKPTAHIGIVIGPKSAGLRPVYDWAIKAVNDGGGAGGRKLEARYFELTEAVMASNASADAMAAKILSDPQLVAVAGTFSFAMAPKFVTANVPYITPDTGDDDVFRAFHTGGYVWRTLESDSTMLWFMLAEAKGRGEKALQASTSVALLTSTDPYGQTFFDWYGFHATELGLKAMPPVQYDQSAETCEPAVNTLLSRGVPDFLIAVPSGPDPVAQATCMVRTMKARSPSTKVLLADSAYNPALLTSLAGDAEGLSGFLAAPDPNSGFAQAFTKTTTIAQPPEHAANALDAIALLAYGLEKSDGLGRKDLDAAMRNVVSGQGTKTSWNDFRQTMALIRAGESPDISGASGPLAFDKEVFTDPTSSFYDRWVVENGAFKITHHVTTATEASPNVTSQSAVARGLKALKIDDMTGAGGSVDLPPLSNNWALVIATSATWKNYRHQADALAHYQALKVNGFDDDHVVLITVDDLANAAENVRVGEVVNEPGGPNVRALAIPDYVGKSLTSTQVMAVLEGNTDPNLPTVLHTQADDNVYVFMVGHGGFEGPYIGMDERSSDDVTAENFISPELFASTVARMKLNNRFRRMLIAVDACHSGVLAPAFEALAIPDVVLFAAAGEAESSFSANYSSQLAIWTADQFAFHLLKSVRSPNLSIRELYTRLYEGVTGSHVQIANQQAFGATTQIMLSEFVSPAMR